jgi:hypothetical protein
MISLHLSILLINAVQSLNRRCNYGLDINIDLPHNCQDLASTWLLFLDLIPKVYR